MTNRAKEGDFENLHNLLTQELIGRIKSGEATTADLKAACDWLKANDVTGVASESSRLAGLAGLIPELDFDDVKKHMK